MKLNKIALGLMIGAFSLCTYSADKVYLTSYLIYNSSNKLLLEAYLPNLTKKSLDVIKFPVHICTKNGNTVTDSFQFIDFKKGFTTAIGAGELTVNTFNYIVKNYNKDVCFKDGDIIQINDSFRFPIKDGEYIYPIGNFGDKITIVGTINKDALVVLY